MKQPWHHSGYGCRQRGMSLVEVMIALALGAFITLGIVQLFTANRESYQMNLGQARLQENARFALDFLSQSVRVAGYTGCSSRVEPRVLVRDGGGSVPSMYDPSEGITAHSGGADGWSPALTGLPAGVSPAAGTDVLVLKSAAGEGISFEPQTADPAATSFVELPADCTDDSCPGYEPGSVLMASDCRKSTVFMVTHYNTQPSNNRLAVVYNTGNEIGGLNNSEQRLAQGDEEFLEDASIYSMRSEYYFVAPGAGRNNRGDTPLALWRKQGSRPAAELVEGIEQMRLLFGEDLNGDRVPDRYGPITAVADPANIITVRLQLTANSVDAVAEDGDGLLRRTFTQTIAVRNRI